MTIDEAKDTLISSIYWNLIMQSPILSGNMQSFIQLDYIPEPVVKIAAPFYDGRLWKDKHIIVHTGESHNGYTNYAEAVNEVGAFGRHNQSEHWVNRVINQCCEEIAKEIGGVVTTRLPD